MRRLTKNAYRDIVHMSQNFLGSKYPFSSLAPTLFHWDYDSTSKFARFRTEDEHKAWKNYKTDGDCIEPQGYNTIKLSYWSLEDPLLHPNIGHEVSHLVISDFIGDMNQIFLKDRKRAGGLGRLANRVLYTIEGWYDSIGYDSTDKLAIDVLADMLNCSRFGYSFLYTWFLEILQGHCHFERSLLKDEFEEVSLSLESIDSIIKDRTHGFRSELPDMEVIIRGRAVLKMLELISPEKESV